MYSLYKSLEARLILYSFSEKSTAILEMLLLIIAWAHTLGSLIDKKSILSKIFISSVIVFETIDGKPIYSIFNLDNKIKELGVGVAIVTTPKDVTQEIVNKLINSGIKAIWNFVPIHLEHPDDIIVENMDLARSLSVFFHRINNK